MKPDLFIDYFDSVRRNRTRFILEGLSVSSGVFILLASIFGFSIFRNGSFGTLSKLSIETVSINTQVTTKSYQGFGIGRVWSLDKSDIDDILEEFKDTISQSGPIYVFPKKKQILAGNGKRDETRVTATHPDIFKIISISMLSGRFINKTDMLKRRKVCVIGRNLAEKWYGTDANPVGKSILIDGTSYKIVGIVKKNNKMVLPFGNEENHILLPYETADAVYNLNGKLTNLVFSIAASEGFEQRRENIIRHIRQRHNVDPDDIYAIRIVGTQEYTHMLNTVFSGAGIFLWVVFIGLIISSLLGVFGVTLLSARERKSEIGIRLAMGARPKDIERQFIMESLTVVFFFTFAGLVASETLTAALRIIYRRHGVSESLFGIPQLSFWGVLLVILLITAGGVLAGYFPARNMIKKQVSELFDDTD